MESKFLIDESTSEYHYISVKPEYQFFISSGEALETIGDFSKMNTSIWKLLSDISTVRPDFISSLRVDMTIPMDDYYCDGIIEPNGLYISGIYKDEDIMFRIVNIPFDQLGEFIKYKETFNLDLDAALNRFASIVRTFNKLPDNDKLNILMKGE